MRTMDIKTEIKQSLRRAEHFLLNRVNTGIPGIKRCSACHNVEKYPDMCLPATYNAVHALVLLGPYQHPDEEIRKNVVDFIQSFQTENGAFRFRNMKDDQIWKGKSLAYSWWYIDNHITNYSTGALQSLKAGWKYPLSFIDSLKEPEALERWLSERDMTDPWLEGNNIVNLAGFLISELESKEPARLQKLMEIMLGWHDRQQDPDTGFWGTNHPVNPAGIMEGMAGAAHNFHLYFYSNREIHYYKPMIDYCLSFIRGKVKSACLDVDVVDILANLLVYGYRAEEIREQLARFAARLIAFQNDDGGFADEKSNGVRRMDGWVGGYFEPQGLSNCFATWFRCVTLAMILHCLDAEEAKALQFRDSIGIGYFNRNYLR